MMMSFYEKYREKYSGRNVKLLENIKRLDEKIINIKVEGL